MSIHDIQIIIRKTTSNNLPVEIYGPAGERLDGAISAEMRKRIAERVARVDALYAGKRRDTTLLKQELQELGQALFASLDADDRRLSDTLVHLPTADGQTPQLQLRIRDVEAYTWPWELLCDSHQPHQGDQEDSLFLALSSRLRLSRYHEKDIPIPDRERLEQLRVLVAIASPTSLAPLESLATREIEELLGLPNSLGERLHLEVLKSATPKALLQCLSKAPQPFHVLHLIAHGHVEGSEAGIILEAEDGTAKFLNADLMAEILRRAYPRHTAAAAGSEKTAPLYPRLVILDACHSARID